MAIFSLGTMKRLAVCQLTLIGLVAVAQCNILVAAVSENSVARDLAAAKTFAFGGIGVAGLMSDGERNLRAILDRSDASQQLQASLIHATPAGELYILVGLRRCDPVAYQKMFPSLAHRNDAVEVARGCMITREPFNRLLSEIQHGDFDDFLSRPAR
jgi:hypothetical protein